MQLQDCFNEFIDYMKSEKNASKYTLKSYESDFEVFSYFLSIKCIEPRVDTITTPILRKYITYLKNDKDYKVETIRRKINSTKSFFNFLVSQEYIDKNPTAAIHAPKSPERLPIYMTTEEIKSIISMPMKHNAEHGLRDKCILEALAMTGVRRSELVALNWEDIDFKNNIIIVKHAKGNKQRVIPITEPLISDIWAYLQTRLPLKNNAIFISELGNRLSFTPLNQLFHKYLKLAGLDDKGYTLHKFRHSYATLLLQNGADLISIKELMGHSDLNSTKIYTHVSTNHLKNEVRKLPLCIE
ncbi:tyrosine-type recombinase/integrase [Clostridium sp.]|uniref:tyrosine-type recombinase/integrase n=1 Tax=Clostridium sp. TaxID=1506 RepID=UPI0039F5F85E